MNADSYLGVNPGIVWDIVDKDILALARCVSAELDRKRGRPSPGQTKGLGPDLGRTL